MKKALLLLSLALVLVACSGPQDESALPDKVTLGTIRVPNDKSLALEEDLFKEFFQDRGIELEVIFFDSGTSANLAFASGDLDFASMGYTNGVVALSQGLDVELIWIHEILGANEALVVQEDSGIESLDDLAGKKLATPFSSTSHYSLMKALEASGLTSQDLTLLDMDTENIHAAWLRGDLDGAYTWEPSLSEIKKTGRVLLDSSDMAQAGVQTANIELVSKDFSQKYPDLVRDYVMVLDMAVDIYRQDPQRAVKANARRLEVDEETIRTQMEGSLWVPAEDQVSPAYLGTSSQPGAFQDNFYETGLFLEGEGKISQAPDMEAIGAFINPAYIQAYLEGRNL